MSFNDFMARIRQLDNRSAQWITRHFYILFFEIVLVIIFIALFVNTLRTIDISVDISKDNIIERLLLNQNIYTLLIVILLLFNSFWTLYIFNSIIRLRSILRNIDYNLGRRRPSDKREDND